MVRIVKFVPFLLVVLLAFVAACLSLRPPSPSSKPSSLNLPLIKTTTTAPLDPKGSSPLPRSATAPQPSVAERMKELYNLFLSGALDTEERLQDIARSLEERSVRCYAIDLLGFDGLQKHALVFLRRLALEDKDPVVRAAAVARLAGQRNQSSWLCKQAPEALSRETDPIPRITWITSIGRSGSREGVDWLVRQTLAENVREACAAVEALSLCGHEKGRERLQEVARSHHNLEIRTYAQELLTERRDKQ